MGKAIVILDLDILDIVYKSDKIRTMINTLRPVKVVISSIEKEEVIRELANKYGIDNVVEEIYGRKPGRNSLEQIKEILGRFQGSEISVIFLSSDTELIKTVSEETKGVWTFLLGEPRSSLKSSRYEEKGIPAESDFHPTSLEEAGLMIRSLISVI